MVSLKRPHFSLFYCVFFPTVMQILVGRLDSYHLTHTKKYMTPINALILKNMSKCVFMQDLDMLKSQCKFVMLLGNYAQQKQVGCSWEVIFQNLGSQGLGRISPSGSSRAAPLTFFAPCSEASGGFNCVSKVLLKSQCKKYGIWKEKIKPHLGKVCIFLPTLLFYKNHRNIML